MLKFNERIFDEHVVVSGGIADYLTHKTWNELLGRYDLLAFHVLVDDVQTTGEDLVLAFVIETSCNGAHWVQKGVTMYVPMYVNQLTSVCLADDGRRPSYALVRIRLQVICSDKAWAQVRVYATGRDTAGVPHMLRDSGATKYLPLQRGHGHKLSEAQKAVLLDLCKKRHLSAEDCAQFNPYDP